MDHLVRSDSQRESIQRYVIAKEKSKSKTVQKTQSLSIIYSLSSTSRITSLHIQHVLHICENIHVLINTG